MCVIFKMPLHQVRARPLLHVIVVGSDIVHGRRGMRIFRGVVAPTPCPRTTSNTMTRITRVASQPLGPLPPKTRAELVLGLVPATTGADRIGASCRGGAGGEAAGDYLGGVGKKGHLSRRMG